MEENENSVGGDEPFKATLTEMLIDRKKTHGEFREHAQITQDLKKVVHHADNWRRLNNSQRESIEMILHKIGRILAGNPDFEDHWEDIAGYANIAKNRKRLPGERG